MGEIYIRIRSLFLLGVNIIQYFAHSMVSAPPLFLFNDEAEALLFGGEIQMLVFSEGKSFRTLELFQNKMFSEASRAPLSPSRHFSFLLCILAKYKQGTNEAFS